MVRWGAALIWRGISGSHLTSSRLQELLEVLIHFGILVDSLGGEDEVLGYSHQRRRIALRSSEVTVCHEAKAPVLGLLQLDT